MSIFVQVKKEISSSVSQPSRRWQQVPSTLELSGVEKEMLKKSTTTVQTVQRVLAAANSSLPMGGTDLAGRVRSLSTLICWLLQFKCRSGMRTGDVVTCAQDMFVKTHKEKYLEVEKPKNPFDHVQNA